MPSGIYRCLNKNKLFFMPDTKRRDSVSKDNDNWETFLMILLEIATDILDCRTKD